MAALLLACTQAAAQADVLPGFDLERLETNVGRGTALMGNGELMDPGGLNVNVLGHYERLPLVVSDGQQNLQVVRDRATTVLSASYGVLPWLELGAHVPLVLWQNGDDPSAAGLAPLAAQGLGTPDIQARFGLMSTRRRQPLDMSADLVVGLPVGAGLALAGDDGPRFQGRMTVGTTLGWFHPAFEAGVLFRPTIQLPSVSGVDKSKASSEIHLGAGVSTMGQGLRGELALRAIVGSQWAMELLGGVRIPLLSGLDGFVEGGPGLGQAVGTPRLRVFAGISYRFEPPPRIASLNEHENSEWQLSMANPTTTVEQDHVRQVSTWELNSLIKDKARAEEQQATTAAHPYQPSGQDQLLLRGDIYFAQGSAKLPGVVPLLDQVVQRFMTQGQPVLIRVQGYTDMEGSPWSNTVMSMQRAHAVRNYLIAQGIPTEQIRTTGFGSSYPVSLNPTSDKERQLNRRAEVLVLTDPDATVTTQAPAP